MTLSLSGCGTLANRLAEAEGDKARADLVDEALDVAGLPDLPPDCRKIERSGVAVGDRLDIALLKSERALNRANSRVSRCANFQDDLRRKP